MSSSTTQTSTDQLKDGDVLADLAFTITAEDNEQYVFAQQDYSSRYLPRPGGTAQAHPALLMQMLAPTKSPSYWIPNGLGAVLGSAQTRFYDCAWVGGTYTISWTVTRTYAKRGRVYQEVVGLLKDAGGRPIVERISQVTYTSA